MTYTPTDVELRPLSPTAAADGDFGFPPPQAVTRRGHMDLAEGESWESFERRRDAEKERECAMARQPGPRAFSATVRATLWNDRIAAGDVVLIDPDAPIEDGCLVLAVLDTDTDHSWTQLATYWEGDPDGPRKRLYKTYWQPRLSALGWEGSEKRNDGFRVIGRVVAAYHAHERGRSLIRAIHNAPLELDIPEPS